MKKKKYTTLSIVPVSTYLEQNILVGSLTQKSIKTDEVNVKDFEAGFSDGSGNDIGFEISFDD